MNVIGLTGPIGHGKTSFAIALSKVEPSSKIFESSQVIAEIVKELHAKLQTIPNSTDLDSINAFTGLLCQIVNETFDYDIDNKQLEITKKQLDSKPIEFKKLFDYFDLLRNQPEILNQGVTIKNKSTLRPILQWLGGFLPSRIDRAMWFKELVRRIYLAKKEGCRLVIVGGIRYPIDAETLRQTGAIIIEIVRPSLAETDIDDPTERERHNIEVDSQVINDGTLSDLDQAATHLLTDVNNQEFKQIYFAKQA